MLDAFRTMVVWRVAQFVLRMLDARRWRCAVPAFLDDLDLFRECRRLSNFEEQPNGDLRLLTLTGTTTVKPGKPGHVCVVLFRSEPVNKPEAKNIVDSRGPNASNEALVLIQPLQSTQQARALLRESFASVNTFTFDMCRSDFMASPMVPPHQLVTGAERQAVLKRARASQLNRMLQSDPVAQYYALKRGSVVRVSQAQDVGWLDNYRVVVGDKL